jgi:FAD/FMN-containing dehydrogenase
MDPDVICRDLNRAKFGGDIVDPSHDRYDALRRVWNGMADCRPAAIVQPRTAAEVEMVVTTAASHNVLLAVRGGGHSIPGPSTCDGGILLDLSTMRSITLDHTSRRITVQGGALLGDIDCACVPAGLVAPAGIISRTGVAGSTLGGGMGWLSRRFGLTIDSLMAANIVTAVVRD